MTNNLNRLHPFIQTKLRVIEHLPRDGDESLIVLKGHLLVEELLFELVAQSVTHPAALREARLTFYNVACLAKASYFAEGNGHVWEAVFALNSLRNGYAHNLEPGAREKHLRAFGRAMARGNEKGGDETIARPTDSLVMGISLLCGALVGLLDRGVADART